MKKISLLLVTLLLTGGLTLAQNAPQYPAKAAGRTMASEYGQWVVHSLNSVTASATAMQLDNCYVKVGTGNKQVFPLNTGPGTFYIPVTIVDGSLTENVTITAVSSPTPNTGPSTINPNSCSFTATFANAHSAGVSIVSNDGGLAEAINDVAPVGGVVTLDSNFNPSGTAVASTTAVYTNVFLEDIRGSVPVWYRIQPSTLTALATPATRSATAGTTQVVSGTATGTWAASAYFVCVTYVDIMGGESPCSASFSFTATASVALNYASPAASTGAVGWRAYAGLTGTSTQYQLPISASTCTLSTLETVYPACAMGAAGVFATATTATSLAPAAGGVAATYRPNTQSHTTFAYSPSSGPGIGLQTNYGPFLISPALTAGQAVVLGTVPLRAGDLNYLYKTIRITGRLTVTPSTGGTDQILVGIGDTTDFSTGTPKAVCTLTETTAITTAAQTQFFSCIMTVNAVGATGSIMPSGFSILQVGAGTTAGAAAVESATAAITVDTTLQPTLNIEFLQTSAAESTTPPQLQDLHVEVIP